jgi:predicted O-methyltransferase YrrM
MTLIELALLIRIIRGSGASSFLEIGTFDGLTVRSVLDNCPAVKKIVTIDLPPEIHKSKGENCLLKSDQINNSMIGTEEIGRRFLNHENASIVRQIRKDSAAVRADDVGGHFDIILIDGNHTYDYCANDTDLAESCLSDNGLMVWHDFHKVKYLAGVTEFLLASARHKRFNLLWLHGPSEETSLVLGTRIV